LVLFGWNHEKEIMEKEKEMNKSGVKWIKYIPEVRVVNS
jgi:methylation protein EvaC